MVFIIVSVFSLIPTEFFINILHESMAVPFLDSIFPMLYEHVRIFFLQFYEQIQETTGTVLAVF